MYSMFGADICKVSILPESSSDEVYMKYQISWQSKSENLRYISLCKTIAIF